MGGGGRGRTHEYLSSVSSVMGTAGGAVDSSARCGRLRAVQRAAQGRAVPSQAVRAARAMAMVVGQHAGWAPRHGRQQAPLGRARRPRGGPRACHFLAFLDLKSADGRLID